MYFLQRESLIQTDTVLFEEPFYVWKFGPVSVAIYRKYLKYGSDKICEDESFDVNKCFNNEEIDFLYKFFIQYATTATSNLLQLLMLLIRLGTIRIKEVRLTKPRCNVILRNRRWKRLTI